MPSAEVGYVEEGIASWYGHPYHGRPTANGEIYNMYEMTAAHRTLPFNTWVKVTDVENGLTTRVRINDRGPFVEGRIIDLSLAAAQAVHIYVAGTARVRLEVVGLPAGASIERGAFAVQVGAFLDRRNAERLQRQLQKRYESVTITEYDSPQGHFYRVRVGSAPTRHDADALAQRLRAQHFIPFVVRVD